MKIVTTFVYPPIPVRSMDWQALPDDYDGAPDAGWQPTGSGATEFEAVLDFYETWEMFRDEPLVAHRPGFEEDIMLPRAAVRVPATLYGTAAARVAAGV